LAVTLANLPGTAAADGTDDLLRTLKPYAEATAGFDSNLFRLPDTAAASQILGKAQLSDYYVRAGGGIDSSIDISKQNFIVQGEIYRNLYEEFGNQDFTEANADLIWNWSIGERWDGDVGYYYDRNRQDFANQQLDENDLDADSRRKTIRTNNSVSGQANFELTREWTLYGTAKVSDISFDNQRTPEPGDLSVGASDSQRKSVGVGADYTTRIGNRIGVYADFIEGDYDNDGSGDSRFDFDEYNVGPTANWKVSGKTRIRGKIKYTNRTYDDPTQEDFDGITWRLTLVRNPAEATTLEAAVYREVSSLNDEISNYAEIDGISIIPQIQLGGKTTLKLLGQYEKRNFKGAGNPSNPPPPGTPQRKDKVATAAAELEWEASGAIKLFGGITYEARSSNQRVEKYEYGLIQVGIRGGF